MTCPGTRVLPQTLQNRSDSAFGKYPSHLFFGSRHVFKVCTGALYLSGYIQYDNSKRYCLKKCTDTWEKKIFTIRITTRKYPHESYAVVVRVIKSEWIFLHYVANNTGGGFVVVDKIIREIFLPCLFFVN